MGDNTEKETTEHPWTLVSGRKKKIVHSTDESFNVNLDRTHPLPPPPPPQYHQQNKITEPCWFFNNGGCRHKDSTEKTADECKYLHLYSENVKRPPHLSTRKPCDKFNLEGECKWHNNCKYSHRNLIPDEWSRFYPGIPYTLRTNVQKRVQIENNVTSIEGRMNVVEFKQDGMGRDVQQIGQTLQEVVRQLRKVIGDFTQLIQKTSNFQQKS